MATAVMREVVVGRRLGMLRSAAKVSSFISQLMRVVIRTTKKEAMIKI